MYLYKKFTRKKEVAFLGTVGYFGGKLIMLLPKTKCQILVVLSSSSMEKNFRKKFTFSGRFKIGQRHLTVSHIPIDFL